jgi:hypothetical protein
LAHGFTMPGREMDCKSLTGGAYAGLDPHGRCADDSILMTTALATLRRLASCLGPVLGLALACSLVTVAFHHHDEHAAGHACAVCSAGHAPAITPAASTGSPAPAPRPECIARTPAWIAPQACVAATAARAPPAA